MRLLLAAEFAEAQLRLHSLDVAMHGIRHRQNFRNVGIARFSQQIVVTAQPPQQAIEQGETVGVAMQDRALCQLDEFRRHAECVMRRF